MKVQLALVALTIVLSACGTSDPQAAVATPLRDFTSTPDPCTSLFLAESIKKVNDLQREFDDASELASNLGREQLPGAIMEMQRIRRSAEDQQIPGCLTVLKAHQLAHMNTVIDTLISFVGGADAAALNQGIAAARAEHDQYTFEIARLLGITLLPGTNVPLPADLPTASP